VRRATFQHEGARRDAPLSAVVREDGVLYASGQVPVDPQIRQVVDGGIEVETWQTREYLKSTLTLACASLADVVKVNTFFTDMTSFSAINGVSRE
jgi:2-iminobutanoate/2-iminopropanoate deaminase